uniref:Uncharacterized protein n=2 Tax=Ditylum brightwellii TaxID=49249 RepID=A0A6S9A0Z1_9STRA|mmetsp:Transcript_7879/g.11482  ORF Transcript_7879/g.11482 Transcript_7879/m.11482 type:complete len:162 (+) Transcript_7879:35-520(+)
MNRVEADETPAEAWTKLLNSKCNRLSTQYLNLLRAATSSSNSDGSAGRHDARAGGGSMQQPNEPPPPLAADAALSALQAKLAAQNLCVASSDMLDLIRLLRLSALLMDEDVIAAEEEEECEEVGEMALIAAEESAAIEAELMRLRNRVDEACLVCHNTSSA